VRNQGTPHISHRPLAMLNRRRYSRRSTGILARLHERSLPAQNRSNSGRRAKPMTAGFSGAGQRPSQRGLTEWTVVIEPPVASPVLVTSRGEPVTGDAGGHRRTAGPSFGAEPTPDVARGQYDVGQGPVLLERVETARAVLGTRLRSGQQVRAQRPSPPSPEAAGLPPHGSRRGRRGRSASRSCQR
jgi:hypothetical protein